MTRGFGKFAPVDRRRQSCGPGRSRIAESLQEEPVLKGTTPLEKELLAGFADRQAVRLRWRNVKRALIDRQGRGEDDEHG